MTRQAAHDFYRRKIEAQERVFPGDVLMERYRLDPERAFGFMVRSSQTGNLELRHVAAGIVQDAVNKAE